MSYSPEQLQAAYKAGYLKATGMDGRDKMDHELRAIEREAASYAATLRQQAARVDEGMGGLCQRNPAPNAAQPMAATSPTVRLEAALSAQPAERQGEAVAGYRAKSNHDCLYGPSAVKAQAAMGWDMATDPTLEPLHAHPAAPVGVPDGVLLLDFAVNHAEKAVGNRGVVFELRFDPLPFRDGNLRDYLLAAAPSAPQGEG